MNRKVTFQPELQKLEDRCVPAVSISFNKTTGIIAMHGSDNTARSDVAVVELKDKGTRVEATVSEFDARGRRFHRASLKVKVNDVKTITFAGYAGNDQFANNTAVASAVNGGDGNDVLRGGAGNDILYGSVGDDYLWGDAGNDAIYGQDGNDSIYGGDGHDYLTGDQGNDYLNGNSGSDSLHGNDGNDHLVGDTWADSAPGNDLMYGGWGDDRLEGGPGDDMMRAGAGNDYLNGFNGKDWLYGEAGEDKLDGGWDGAMDQLYGGTERDTFVRYYRSGFLGFRSYSEEELRDWEGIFGSWDRTEEIKMN